MEREQEPSLSIAKGVPKRKHGALLESKGVLHPYRVLRKVSGKGNMHEAIRYVIFLPKLTSNTAPEPHIPRGSHQILEGKDSLPFE